MTKKARSPWTAIGRTKPLTSRYQLPTEASADNTVSANPPQSLTFSLFLYSRLSPVFLGISITWKGQMKDGAVRRVDGLIVSLFVLLLAYTRPSIR